MQNRLCPKNTTSIKWSFFANSLAYIHTAHGGEGEGEGRYQPVSLYRTELNPDVRELLVSREKLIISSALSFDSQSSAITQPTVRLCFLYGTLHGTCMSGAHTHTHTYSSSNPQEEHTAKASCSILTHDELLSCNNSSRYNDSQCQQTLFQPWYIQHARNIQSIFTNVR